MPDTYCVDTSSFLKIFEDYPSSYQLVLDGLDTLIQSDRILTVRVVLQEVAANINRNNQRLQPWLEARADRILVPEDDDLLLATLQVVRNYGDLIDVDSRRLQADPFVVGAAVYYDLIVVSDELPSHLRRQRGRNTQHIPDVCAALNINCLTLAQLLSTEGVI